MDFKLEMDARDFATFLQRSSQQGLAAAKEGMEDATNELARIASEIAPFDKGILQRSHTNKVTVSSSEIKGEVEFSVREGSFNYALWIHEGVYSNGDGTDGRDGTTGWSGKHYVAGRKYLERPLKGEEAKFYDYIGKKILNAVGD